MRKYNYKIIIGNVDFEWNLEKAGINFLKHGISFEEAATVFFDENALIYDDPEHSDEEERMLIVGFSKKEKLVVVCYCIRNERIIRITSARKLSKSEKKKYIKIRKGY